MPWVHMKRTGHRSEADIGGSTQDMATRFAVASRVRY